MSEINAAAFGPGGADGVAVGRGRVGGARRTVPFVWTAVGVLVGFGGVADAVGIVVALDVDGLCVCAAFFGLPSIAATRPPTSTIARNATMSCVASFHDFERSHNPIKELYGERHR